MSPVPLIPFQRPVPQVFSRPSPGGIPTIKDNKKKVKKMASKKAAAAARFESDNTDDIKTKHPDVQRLWRILEKMDVVGTYVSDDGIIVLDGEGPDHRKPSALKLSAADVELLRPYGVLDGPIANDPATATGVIVSPYQLIQIAFDLGRQVEAAKAAADFKKAVSAPAFKAAAETPAEEEEEEYAEEDEDFDEDDDDDDIDVLDEDEDEDLDSDDNEDEDDWDEEDE